MFNIFLKVSAGNICNTSDLYRLHGVEAAESVTPKSTVVFKMDKAIATSLLSQKLQGHVDDIVWIGSSDGFLYKVLGVLLLEINFQTWKATLIILDFHKLIKVYTVKSLDFVVA